MTFTFRSAVTRTLTVAAAVAVAAGAFTGAAVPAHATGESFQSVSPVSVDPGAAAQTFTFDLTLATQNTWRGAPTIGGYYVMLPGFDFSVLTCADVTFTPALSADAMPGKAGACDAFEAGKGLHFTGPYIESMVTRAYTVTINNLTPPQAEGCYLVGLGNWDASEYLGGVNVQVGATCAAAPPAPPAPAVITIRIDGNGGTCKTTAVTGFEGSWRTAPNEYDCYRWGLSFTSFNTSADGRGMTVAPGGNLHLTGDNTLYAQWAEPRVPSAPQNVKVTPGRNKVTVSWEAPADGGTYPVTNYVVGASPRNGYCVTTVLGPLADANSQTCTMKAPAGVPVTFTAQALNGAGWSDQSAGASATAWNVELTDAGRRKVLFGLFQAVTMDGRAPGMAPGTKVIAQWQPVASAKAVPSADSWRTLATTTVGGNGRFSVDERLPRSSRNDAVALRFIVADPLTGQFEATHAVVRVAR